CEHRVVEEPADHAGEHQRNGADDRPVAELDEVLRQRHPLVGVRLGALPALPALGLHRRRRVRSAQESRRASSSGRACPSVLPDRPAPSPVTSSTDGCEDVSVTSLRVSPAESFPPLPSSPFSPRRSSTSVLKTLRDLPMFFAIIGSLGAPKIRRMTMTRMR